MYNNIFTEVKQRLNIRQVVEFYGYKVNTNGQFICAFHNDHKPSASIKNDYFNLNTNFKNVHTFNNNTIGITNYDTLPYRSIIIIKATFTGVLRVKTSDIYGKRLTLNELLELVAQGKAKKYNKLSEVIGL